jgi:hypothetical protein
MAQDNQPDARDNISFWINADERLHSIARACVMYSENSTIAAKKFILSLKKHGETKTPNGFRYTISSVSSAMENMK